MFQPIAMLRNIFTWLYGILFRKSIEVPTVQDSILLCSEGHQEKNVAHDEYDDEEVIPDEECVKECGMVTMVNEHYGLIDGRFYFEHDYITLFEEGMKVYYYSYEKNGQKKINRVIEPSEPDSNDSEEIFHKKLVAQVVKRREREIVVQPDLTFVLNDVAYAFIPAVGDWLEIECIVEIDETKKNLAGDVLKIIKIDALCFKSIVGEIDRYNIRTGIGVIESEFSFNKTSCTPGYMPRVGDTVSADVIESEQGNCNWRALSVTPENTYRRPHNVSRNLPNMDDIHFGDTGNMVVSKLNRVQLQHIGEETQIEICANNRNTLPYEIVGVEIMSTESQLSLINPQCPPNVIMAPHDTVTFTFQCHAKSMGSTKELIILNFCQFKIGRWINITVGNSVIQNGYSVRNVPTRDNNFAEAARKTFFAGEKRLVIGQRLIRPPAFIANKLPLYEIPERFAKKIFRELETNSERVAITKVKDIAPFLLQELNVKNYKDSLHSVLYMEELTIQIQMRRYDIHRAIFDICGTYFRLEVPNLMERRPSVVIGDRVIAINPNDPAGHRFEGFVHRTSNKHIYIGFHPQFHAAYAGEDFSIEFHASRTNFRRYHHAVNLAMKVLGPEFLFPVSVPKREPQVEFAVESTLLRKLKTFEDEQRKLEQESNMKSGNFTKQNHFDSSPNNTKPTKKKVLYWFDRTLNEYQKRAVKNIIIGEARPLPYLLFGPPGTGKTVTLIETILQIHALMPHSRILVVAPSNAAADLIALRLLDSKVLLPGDLVRMVAFRCVVDKTIPERLIPYSVTGDIAREGTRESKEHFENGVRMCVSASDVGRNRIIIATCAVVGTLYTMGFSPGHFTHIIMDEAGQISEPESMIPLSLLDLQTAQTILAGDPLQLGPCIFSVLARSYGLAESFFERMIKRTLYNRDPIGFPNTGGYDPRLVTRLVYNYRSLPEILALSNDLFYDSELRPMIPSTEGTEVDLLKQVRHILPKRQLFDSDDEDDNDTEPLPPAVVFHGVRGYNLQTPDSPSWFNPTEAGQVLHYLRGLYSAGVGPEDIGIISPYTKQCAHLREVLHEVNLKLPKIGSVEEFQGQEFKVIIMCTVRSNEDGAHVDSQCGLGFIASPRRLNVAVSRAQALLIIIGNPHLLTTDYYWRSVIMYAVNLGGYRGCNLPNI